MRKLIASVMTIVFVLNAVIASSNAIILCTHTCGLHLTFTHTHPCECPHRNNIESTNKVSINASGFDSCEDIILAEKTSPTALNSDLKLPKVSITTAPSLPRICDNIISPNNLSFQLYPFDKMWIYHIPLIGTTSIKLII